MSRRRTHERDQAPSPFTPVLQELCRATGAGCAALVDNEGETVDYAGLGDPFEIRILAAELRLLAQHLDQAVLLRSTTEMLIRARRGSFFLRSLPEGYALVLRLGRRATSVSDRSLSIAVRELCAEAGFAAPMSQRGGRPPGTEVARQWKKVEVQVEGPRSRRPVTLATPGGPTELEVMGRIATNPSSRETGYRVRLANGEEGTLIRERLGRWYLEEDAWD